MGENERDIIWHTTMCPKTRRLIKITADLEERTEEMFNIMLGDNLQGWKEFIRDFEAYI